MPNAVAMFPVDPVLSGVAVAYRNGKLIADEVLPRVPVSKQNFKYQKFAPEDTFTIPNTTVGRTSRVNQVEFGFTDEDSSCIDRALEELVPESDVQNAPQGYNPVSRAVESTMDIILLAREKRAADLVFDEANYAANNTRTLSAPEKVSSPDSDPIKIILTALDKCIRRPNIIVMGQRVWSALRQHPKIVKATHGNAGDSGLAARQAVAEMFETDKILVGEGFYNAAAKGQKLSSARIWGDKIALIFQDTLADTRGRVTFGFTAQFRAPEVRLIPDPDVGAQGGTKVRVSECVRELITAGDLGYLIQDVVA